jgi:hypothetical protein
MSLGIADPLLVSDNAEPSRPVPHYAESTVAPTNRNITVRSSYFKKDERVHTNQGEHQFDDDDNQETGTSTLSGDQLRNPEGITKRRKLWDPQNYEDVSNCFISTYHYMAASSSTVVHSWYLICSLCRKHCSQLLPMTVHQLMKVIILRCVHFVVVSSL